VFDNRVIRAMRFAAIPLLLLAANAAGCALPGAGHRLPTAPLTAPLGAALVEATNAAPSPLLVQLSRVKSPVARPLKFSAEQRAAIHGELQPGDILLTFTAGISSNAVFPGKFKHSIIYLGDGFYDHLPLKPELRDSLPRVTTKGEPPDMIEAVAEGVILSSFDRLLATRINRLMVLRPRISLVERDAYLAEALSYHGQKYDFSFDFTNHSRKVCTEIIYCSLHGRGGIEFQLVPRAGRLTLTAEDIAHMHLRESSFECILLADDDPTRPGHARVVFGHEAEDRLAQIMRARSATAGSTTRARPSNDGRNTKDDWDN
jgi:hypothetical protein